MRLPWLRLQQAEICRFRFLCARLFCYLTCLSDDLAVGHGVSWICIRSAGLVLAGSHCFNADGVGPGHMASFVPNENVADSSSFYHGVTVLFCSYIHIYAQAGDTRASFGRLDISGVSTLPPGAGLEARRALACFLFALILYLLPRKATK